MLSNTILCNGVVRSYNNNLPDHETQLDSKTVTYRGMLENLLSVRKQIYIASESGKLVFQWRTGW